MFFFLLFYFTHFYNYKNSFWLIFYNTPIRYHFQKSAWNQVYPANFWNTREIGEIQLIGWFRRLETKEHWLFTENQNLGLVYIFIRVCVINIISCFILTIFTITKTVVDWYFIVLWISLTISHIIILKAVSYTHLTLPTILLV